MDKERKPRPIAEIEKDLSTSDVGSDRQMILEQELDEARKVTPAVETETVVPVVAETKKTLPVEIKTHWKKLKNPDYLGSYDFQPNEERIVTVKRVVVETVKTAEGTGDCVVVHFMEPYKPMILNTTNGKTLTKLFESPYIEEWNGKSFKLVVKSSKRSATS